MRTPAARGARNPSTRRRRGGVSPHNRWTQPQERSNRMTPRPLTRFARALALATIVAAVASPLAFSAPTDGRSPDTRDAADVAQLAVADGRSPDTIDAASAAQLVVTD